MNIETCRDIFDAVYINVRETFIKNKFSTKIKSKTVSESSNEDENLTMTATTSTDPKSESNINTKEVSATLTETVKEITERKSEEEAVVDIRMELEEKFPYALAAACSNLATLDKLYRDSRGYDPQNEFCEFFLDLPDAFPLSDRFAHPCVMFVSSMVLIDVDEKKSDDFYEKYALGVAQIASDLSFECGSTVEKYPY